MNINRATEIIDRWAEGTLPKDDVTLAMVAYAMHVVHREAQAD